jgi:ADP-ribosylation factor-like protein 1
VYVIDSADRERLSITRAELMAMLQEEELHSASLLVLANKQDLPGALSAAEISEAMHLTDLKDRSWSIQKTSALKGEGLDAAFHW